MYRTGYQSYLVGLDPDSGRAVGTVAINPAHLSGMGFVGSWLFAQDDNPKSGGPFHPTVRRYRIAALREIDYQRFLTVELYTHTANPQEAAEKSFRFLSSLLRS